MEIMAAANTHNQKELRLYAPNEQQQAANATTLNSGARSPFQREVREWQRIDPDTGALLTGRLEADRWINGPLNKYGKKSSSSLSNSSNNSTTASQTTTIATNLTSLNTHKPLANKISLHAIVGSNGNNNNYNSNNMTTATTTSSTPSPTMMATTTTIPTAARTSWQQPTLYRQNSYNNKNVNLMKSRVGDNNNINCCSGNSLCRSSSASSSSDESRSYTAAKTETDLRHLQQPQQHIQVKQNDRLTPTHMPHSYQRVDLESFRHYSNNNENANANNNSNSNHNNINDTDDDGLRLSNRHQRRQQIPSEIFIPSLERSRSISTDDLSTEWDINDCDSKEPAEWRRVSKLRRSFQSSTQKNQNYGSPNAIRRPLDLPTNSVSVSKIRAELENGRRLNTVMRNNHVDLAALSSILNGNNEKEIKSPLTTKRDTFLTAESLKEIRGKLKKLSDESLYKEDFIISQQTNNTNPEIEHLVNDQTKVKQTFANRESPERYRVLTKPAENNNKHTTNSLESRVKYKDTNSVDWHTRRKSYGFEKMSPPEKAMLRMDASTDSGLGRSGEIQNWSPTSEATSTNRTVVHFGETGNISKAAPLVQRRYRPQKSYEESENSHEEDSTVTKRHSIAVDESQYVRDNAKQTTQIHLNGFYEPGSFSKFVQSTESTTTTDRGQQKRVEFSKTEVHFATESGRVNIVETDSKPPPTNNFRRRRSRSSSVGPLQSLVKSATTVSTTNSIVAGSNSATVAMPLTLFGDDNLKKKTIASTTVAYRAPLVGSPEPAAAKDNGINVTVTVPSIHNNDSYALTESSRSSYASTSGVDTTDCDTDEMTSLRGILKNKPAKPKPYVLGENIDKPDELWGVQLKPVVGSQTKTERVYKSESPILIETVPQKSVAERIQELGTAASASAAALQQSNNFSTKINVSLGSSNATANNWEDSDLPKSNVMSIKLHSPQATIEVQPPLKVVPPIAKPRTITIQESSAPKILTATTVKQATFQSSLPTKDSLKIVKEARGARQLREHELSYFGVPVTSTSEDEKPKTKYATISNFRNSPKRSLPLRKLSEESTFSVSMETEKEREQWHLENDKPDLLKHNPIEMKPAERRSLKKKAELDEDEEHLYENIANDITPVFKVKAATAPQEQYNRKMDLKRDFEILSEMNQNADQTLRELSDEAALKDRRRRSLQRRNSKPLETIDEKTIAERINDSCIAVKISRSTYASEARKTSRHSTPSPSGPKVVVSSRERSSSQSSVECCPRARSRSLSSEKEYDVTKSKTPRTTHIVRHKTTKPTQSRSSSLDSQRSSHSQYSSGDEPQQRGFSSSFRREDRSRTKTKRITSSATTSTTRDKHHEDKVTRLSSSNKHPSDSKHLSSTTPSSKHRERVECKQDNSTESKTKRLHSSSSSGLQRSTNTSSSGRRHKDDARDSQRIKRPSASTASRAATERVQQAPSKHNTRSLREDERNSSQRSSAHRLERSDKDKEKTSKSSKDLLLLGLLIMGATQPTNLHKRFRSLQSFHIPPSP